MLLATHRSLGNHSFTIRVQHFRMSASLKTAAPKPNPAHLRLLEAAENATRDAFGCAFSTADEYESALILERRAQGHYGSQMNPWPALMFVGASLAMAGTALLFN